MSEFICEFQHITRIIRRRLNDGLGFSGAIDRATRYSERIHFPFDTERDILAHSMLAITSVVIWEFLRFKGIPLPSLINVIPLLPFAKSKGKGNYMAPSDDRHNRRFETGQRFSRPFGPTFIAKDGTEQHTVEGAMRHGGISSTHDYEERKR